MRTALLSTSLLILTSCADPCRYECLRWERRSTSRVLTLNEKPMSVPVDEDVCVVARLVCPIETAAQQW